jgi:FkbM family methyltransferase
VLRAKGPSGGRPRSGASIRLIVRRLRRGDVFSPDIQISFAQEGEDLVVARLFEQQARGFYVDVGAHHPTRFSNTWLLYRRGWRGINVDATPGSMEAFRRKRPEDINLELAVSSEAGHRRLYMFDEAALNSVSEELSAQRAKESHYSMSGTVDVLAMPLRDVLSEHLPPRIDVIDLLSVDVEGHDLDVLQSNDWVKYRPRVVLVEILGSTLAELGDRDEAKFLREQGYVPFAKLVNTVVFVEPRAMAVGK